VELADFPGVSVSEGLHLRVFEVRVTQCQLLGQLSKISCLLEGIIMRLTARAVSIKVIHKTKIFIYFHEGIHFFNDYSEI
jgi:hypothetical protein